MVKELDRRNIVGCGPIQAGCGCLKSSGYLISRIDPFRNRVIEEFARIAQDVRFVHCGTEEGATAPHGRSDKAYLARRDPAIRW